MAFNMVATVAGCRLADIAVSDLHFEVIKLVCFTNIAYMVGVAVGARGCFRLAYGFFPEIPCGIYKVGPEKDNKIGNGKEDLDFVSHCGAKKGHDYSQPGNKSQPFDFNRKNKNNIRVKSGNSQAKARKRVVYM